MKVLVTGGAGFIGSNLVKELLLNKNIEVRVLDDLSNGSKQNLDPNIEKIDFIKGSITDNTIVDKACKDIDIVFHLAAKISVEDSIKNPQSTNFVNVDGTLNLLMAANKHRIKKFVFSSSAAVYGCTDRVPTKETTTASPESPYALQKYVGEKYCRYFSQYYGLDTVCLRYFNVYGPHQQESGGYAGVIYKFIKSTIAGQTINIEGDGEQTRDFVFVEDIVRANMAIANSQEKHNGKVYNVGTGKETSINGLYKSIKAVSNSNLNAQHSEQRSGDIKRSCADITLIKNELGFEPRSSLDDGLKKTISWIKG